MFDSNTALQQDVFQMFVEKDGEVKPHNAHLGTDKRVAETFVFEQIENGADSVALRFGKKLVKIYDYRDLEEK